MTPPERSSRRRFLKTFALATAYSKVLNTDWFGVVVAEVKPPAKSTLGILRLNVGDFPALRAESGSVRVGTSSLANNIPKGIFYPILINRGPGNVFYALNAECTHAGCSVAPFSRASGSSTCPCHGSRFGLDGRILTGPASFPLQPYRTVFDGVSNLTIEIPDWPHEVVGSIVQSVSQPTARFQLEFLAFANLEYELVFRPALESPWSRISFALTPDGPANQSSLAGTDDFTKVYVDRTAEAGFYAVTIRIKPV